MPAPPALAGIPGADIVIQVLFADLPNVEGADANGDGLVTVADVIVFPVVTSPTPTPTPVGLLFDGLVSDLIPHAVGDQLTYRVTDPTGAVTFETTTSTSSDPGGAFDIDDQEVDGQQKVLTHQVQEYTDTGNRLIFTSFTDLLFTPHVRTICSPRTSTSCPDGTDVTGPGLLRLMTPLITGQVFATTVCCDLEFADGTPIGYATRTDTFTPREVLASYAVAAGTFAHVVHVSGSTEVVGVSLETDEIYLAPGVGPILQVATVSGQVTRRELLSGTINNIPVGQTGP